MEIFLTSIFKPFNVDIKYNQRIIMRDNISLSADIYFPKDRNKPLPVILTRTPYDNSSDDIVESAIISLKKDIFLLLRILEVEMILKVNLDPG